MLIVPCYNYGLFLPECVDSVLTQTGVDVRLLIIDDASSDDSGEVAAVLAAKDLRITFRRHARNCGHIATYNEGIDWVSAQYMLLLSADDYLLPGALQRASALMDGNEGVTFTFGAALGLDSSTGTVSPIRTLPRSRDVIMGGASFIRVSGGGNVVPGPTAVVRSEIQKRAGDTCLNCRTPATWRCGCDSPAMEGWGSSMPRRRSIVDTGRRCRVDYYAGYLPDLEQRELVLNHFFSHQGRKLPSWEKLYRRAMKQLGSTAFGRAATALERGETERSRNLLRLAVRVSPPVIQVRH